MVLFKSCPRCGGDVHINRDFYGEYKECLMCGFMVDIERKDDIVVKTVSETNKKTAKKVIMPKVATAA